MLLLLPVGPIRATIFDGKERKMSKVPDRAWRRMNSRPTAVPRQLAEATGRSDDSARHTNRYRSPAPSLSALPRRP